MEHNIEQVDNKNILTVKGDVAIQNAAEFCDLLQKAFDGAGHIVLKLEDMADMRLSCFQLVYAAQLSAKEQGKTFELVSESGNPDTGAMFLHAEGCSIEDDKSCLWIKSQ